MVEVLVAVDLEVLRLFALHLEELCLLAATFRFDNQIVRNIEENVLFCHLGMLFFLRRKHFLCKMSLGKVLDDVLGIRHVDCAQD